jgi:hypothetical protein
MRLRISISGFRFPDYESRFSQLLYQQGNQYGNVAFSMRTGRLVGRCLVRKTQLWARHDSCILKDHYVLFKFCFTREGAHGPPLVNPLNNVFFKFMM